MIDVELENFSPFAFVSLFELFFEYDKRTHSVFMDF